MNKAEVANLSIGLYRVFWKSGGWSLAAIGRDGTGKPWLAPVNWINGATIDRWYLVSSVVRLHKGKTNAVEN